MLFMLSNVPVLSDRYGTQKIVKNPVLCQTYTCNIFHSALHTAKIYITQITPVAIIHSQLIIPQSRGAYASTPAVDLEGDSTGRSGASS